MRKIKNTMIIMTFILFVLLGSSDGPGSTLETNLIGLIGMIVLFYPIMKIIKNKE